MTTSASALQLTLGIIKPSVAAHQPHVQGEKPRPFVHLGEAVLGSERAQDPLRRTRTDAVHAPADIMKEIKRSGLEVRSPGALALRV